MKNADSQSKQIPFIFQNGKQTINYQYKYFQMGNQLFVSNPNDTTTVPQNYYITTRNTNTNIVYMTNKWTDNQYIMRQLITNSPTQRENIHLLANKKISYKCKHLTNLVEKIQVKDQSYCSEQFKLCLIFDRPYKTLRDEIHERKVSRTLFCQQQILTLLQVCSSALRYLKEIGQTHQNISSNNIFKTKNGQYVLSDPWLNFQPQVFPCVNHVYYSPQKMQLKNNIKHSKINQYASDLFSLGMVALQALNLDYMDHAYNRKEINHAFLSEKINSVQYPVLRNQLQGLLSMSPKRRMSIAHQIEAFSSVSHQQTKLLPKINMNASWDAKQIFKDNKKESRDYCDIKNRNLQKQSHLQIQPSETLSTSRTQAKNTQKQSEECLTQKNQKLQDTKVVSDIQRMKSPKCNFIPQQINILIQSKLLKLKEQDDNQEKKVVENQQYLRIQQNMSSNLLGITNDKSLQSCLLQVNSQAFNEKIPPKSSQFQYHLLTYDFEQPVNSSVSISKQKGSQKIQNKSPDQKISSPETQNETIEDDQTPPKKLVKQTKYNSTIMEVSDSQNQSCQEQTEVQYVIQKYQVGSKYEGYKKNGMRNGRGKFSYHDGGYYQGFWKNDKMNGEGKLYYPSGKLAYQGEWKDDQFYGHGKVYNDNMTETQQINYKNFNTLQEEWDFYQGNLISDTKEGHGRIMFSNGQIFQGDFVNDKMSGNGTFYRKDGVVIKGLWKGSKLVVTL